MRKFNRVLSTCLLTTTSILMLPHCLSSMAIAQTNSQQQVSWWQIFQKEPPVDERPGGPRPMGLNFCAIAPRSIRTNTEVWSNQPMFVWRGNLKKVEVRTQDREKVLWSQTVAETDNRVTYSGEPLQPGQTYNWIIFNSQNSPLFFIPFKVMDASERDRIQVGLTNLDQALKDKGATPEEIAMQRANYFAQQELWSDVLKEVYSVPNPSPELEAMIEQIPTKLCSRQRL